MKNIFDITVCPLCGSNFLREGNSLICRGEGQKHTFDIAKSGYVNLLPPGKGKNSRTGDDKEMVRSRSRFLDLGLYDKISNTVSSLILKYYPVSDTPESICFTDSGCGTGFHTCKIADNISNNFEKHVLGVAFDASKHAVSIASKSAARKLLTPNGGIGGEGKLPTELFFFAGNIFSLPLKSESMGAVLSMFAPIAWEECNRILTENGILVVTAAGENHLIELKELLYDNIVKKKSVPVPTGDFMLAEHLNLKYKVDLCSNENIMDLYNMTPFRYKTSPASTPKLSDINNLTVTVETDNYVFLKRMSKF